jgi:hypothetical protein
MDAIIQGTIVGMRRLWPRWHKHATVHVAGRGDDWVHASADAAPVAGTRSSMAVVAEHLGRRGGHYWGVVGRVGWEGHDRGRRKHSLIFGTDRGDEKDGLAATSLEILRRKSYACIEGGRLLDDGRYHQGPLAGAEKERKPGVRNLHRQRSYLNENQHWQYRK